MHPNTSFNYDLIHSQEIPELSPLPSIRSDRAATIAKWFGIENQLPRATTSTLPASRTDRALLRSLLPKPGQITFFTGASGAGKSSMLRELRSLRTPKTRWIDLATDIHLPDKPLVDCFRGAELDRTLALLSHVGLAEAWSYLRTPSELSEGQRWRLKLALAMHESQKCKTDRFSRTILIADEFAALLDRVTASIVARCLRRSIDATPKLAAIVATSHEDLTRALAADWFITCDFRLIEVRRRQPSRD
jgi:hypothetical protein